MDAASNADGVNQATALPRAKARSGVTPPRTTSAVTRRPGSRAGNAAKAGLSASVEPGSARYNAIAPRKPDNAPAVRVAIATDGGNLASAMASRR